MATLADVLELIHGSSESYRSVRATLRTWHDTDVMAEAWDREGEEEGGDSVQAFSLIVFDDEDDEDEQPQESITRIWFVHPDRGRMEIETAHGTQTFVSDRGRTQTYAPGFGAIEQQGAHSAEAGPHQLDARQYLAGVHLEVVGETTVAGRAAVRVRGLARRGARHRAGLDHGADEYELVVDAERGVLLRSEARSQGRPFAVTEVVDIAFDEPLPPETFTLELPPGERFRRPDEIRGFEQMTIEEAAASVEFPVWMPGGLGPRWETTHAIVIPADERSATPPMVALHYFHETDGQFSLNQGPATGRTPSGESWTHITRSGRDIFVSGPDSPRSRRPTLVRLELDGTRIDLQGNGVDRDRLVDIAASLVRAPRERQRLFGPNRD